MKYRQIADRIPDNAHTAKLMRYFPQYAEEYLKTPIPILPYSKYRLYRDTGDRLEYENIYIDIRRRAIVFWAMMMTGHDEYLHPLEDTLCAICDFHTWSFPAHVAADASMEQEVTRIDLFASETAFMLSEILYMMEDRLAPGVCERIRYELMRRIVRPYTARHDRWGLSNWSAVCVAGVIATFMYLGLDRDLKALMPWIRGNMQDFLDSFMPDGCCREGSLYWSFGFGNFVYAASLLREYTEGGIDYFKLPKVRRIAEYGFNCYFGEDMAIPYADGPHHLTFNIGLYHFLKKEYPELPVPDEKYEAKFGDELRFRYADFSRNLFWYDASLKTDSKKTARVDYPDSQWFIRNKQAYSFSCKGGDNDEPHNHDDVGSFFVIHGRDYVLDDIGWPDYDRDYFDPELRYTKYINAMSQGHSVPIVNGQGQKPGKRFAARVLEAEEDRIVLDLSAAYDIPGLKLIRTYLTDAHSVTVRDEISGAETVTERMTTRIEPVPEENGVRIAGCLLTSGNGLPTLSDMDFIPRLVSRLGMKDRETVYFIDYAVPGNGTFACTLHLE